MKDTQLNPLTKNQRKLLQYGVVLILLVFLTGYFFFITRAKNTSVYLEVSKLQVFDESLDFAYPDLIEVHYPFFLVVKPEENKTLIYNLEDKKLEKTVNEIALDYSDGQLLYNRGAETYLGDKPLGFLCEQGVIEAQNVYCVTKVDPNSISQKVISIDIGGKNSEDIYASENLITDISVVNGELFIGEINQTSKKSYLVINNQQIETSNIISLIYELQGKPYFASFKSPLNDEQLGFYLIEKEKIIEQNKDKIIFYEQNDN